jgi:hypothetical protein
LTSSTSPPIFRSRSPIEDAGGLLRIAVTHNRADLLLVLLDRGFDPDERLQLDIGDPDRQAFTWGMPLAQCARTGKYEMAEMLLKHGAEPIGGLIGNTGVKVSRV